MRPVGLCKTVTHHSWIPPHHRTHKTETETEKETETQTETETEGQKQRQRQRQRQRRVANLVIGSLVKYLEMRTWCVGVRCVQGRGGRRREEEEGGIAVCGVYWCVRGEQRWQQVDSVPAHNEDASRMIQFPSQKKKKKKVRERESEREIG